MSLPSRVKRLVGDESGASLVEFALVCLLFFFLFFALIDFGRLGSAHVMAEKAAQIAARTAIVRPPVCAGVPPRHQRGALTEPRFGTSCRFAAGVCANPGTFSCTGADAGLTAEGQDTANRIWERIRPLLPPDATIENVRYEYRFDPNLGFLGGPYTPMVTVEITPPPFQFASPLGAMASALSPGSTLETDQPLPYRAFSVSLPAEDLAHGAGQ